MFCFERMRYVRKLWNVDCMWHTSRPRSLHSWNIIFRCFPKNVATRTRTRAREEFLLFTVRVYRYCCRFISLIVDGNKWKMLHLTLFQHGWVHSALCNNCIQKTTSVSFFRIFIFVFFCFFANGLVHLVRVVYCAFVCVPFAMCITFGVDVTIEPAGAAIII